MLIDKFLDDAIEVDVDALSDGDDVRDRRHHGAHRARRRPFRRQRVRLPPKSIEPDVQDEIRRHTVALAES